MLFVIGLCNIVNAKNDKQINKNNAKMQRTGLKYSTK